jgi:cytochrome c
MGSFEINKILGAVLGTCLFLLSLNIAAGALFAPHTPAKPGYNIIVPEHPVEEAKPGAIEEPIENLLASADVKRGETAAKICTACHTFPKGGLSLVGPNLWNIVNRAKASVAGYNYSTAMKGQSGSWSINDLNSYLKSPMGVVPGTKMTFPGIPKGSARADMIAFLNSLADNPAPLPKAGAPSAQAPK